MKPSRLALACLLALALLGRAEAEEKIHSYHSDIRVRLDGSLDVTETIIVTAEGRNIRRGIFRDFPTVYKGAWLTRVDVPFEMVSALRNSSPETFRTEKVSNGTRVYLGEASRMLPQGRHTYQLRYRTDFQLGFFEEHDELYWNVTGNGWVFPIDKASATIELPPGTDSGRVRLQAYTGPSGSQASDYVARLDPATGKASFETNSPLGRYEGLTVVVGFPKGIVAEPTASMIWMRWFRSNPFFAGSLAGLFSVIGYYAFAWWRVGRDPKSGTIIPLFEVPRNLSPASARFILEMGFDDKCFAASIVNMAVHGHLSIDEIGDVFSLHKQRDDIPLSEGEEQTSSWLFPLGTETFRLENDNHEAVGKARRALEGHLIKEYEGRLFFMNRWWLVPGMLFSALTLVLAFKHHIVYFIVLALVTLVLALLFAHLLKRPGAIGRRLMDQIEGFRMYLRTAEGDDLRARHPPELTPELFERFLPYAIALDVENEWGDQFAQAIASAGQAQTEASYRPVWYNGNLNDFQPSRVASFADNLGSSLSTSISSAASPPGSSSGTSGGFSSGGGGGFSGGGGGGGGGGGW